MKTQFLRSKNVWNAEKRKFEEALIEIRGSKISSIRWGKTKGPLSKCRDYGQAFIGPSAIDLHIHSRDFEESHKEDFDSLEAGAFKGGVASMACMANTRPRLDEEKRVREFIRKTKNRKVDIRCFAAVTKNLEGQEPTNWDQLLKLPIVGLSDDGKPLLDERMMEAVLCATKKAKKILSVHEEDTRISNASILHLLKLSMRYGIEGSPPEAESSMVERDLKLAMKHKAHVHFCHISSASSLKLFAKYRAKVSYSAEITPHHGLLQIEDFEALEQTKKSLFKVCPVIRGEEDRREIHKALRNSLLDVFASDHAPHSMFEKDLPIEDAMHGIISLEYHYPLYLELRRESGMSWSRFFYALSERPAQLLGESTCKGRIAENYEASFVIFDPESRHQINFELSKSKNSPMEGRKLRGELLEHWICGTKVYG